MLFSLEGGWVIDATRRGNSARWINHSCAPNCEIEEEGQRIFIEARRDIRLGGPAMNRSDRGLLPFPEYHNNRWSFAGFTRA